MSIFVSIASYRDPELVRTIKSAIDNASRPNEIYFGLVIQDFDKEIPDLSWLKNSTLLSCIQGKQGVQVLQGQKQ